MAMFRRSGGLLAALVHRRLRDKEKLVGKCEVGNGEDAFINDGDAIQQNVAVAVESGQKACMFREPPLRTPRQ